MPLELTANLDSLTEAELLALCEAFYALGSYADNKRKAMHWRAAGNIEQARFFEATCDQMYRELPAWAKSW